MRRHNGKFEIDPEFFEDICRSLHDLEVTVTTHDNSNDRLHAVI
jgi:hypothetical protein